MITEAALAWYEAGASVLPAQRGKRPIMPWRDHQTERVPMSADTDLSGYDGFGIVTGYGGFEMLETEGGFDYNPLLARLAEERLLVAVTTYVERTPSGGLHFVYRVDGEQEGSTKLARSAEGKTWIETRGRYGWTIMAPSGGAIHEEIAGGRWETIMNSEPGIVPILSEQDVARLYDICREFDRYEPPAYVAEMVHRPALPITGDLAPGQDYENRNSWDQILGPLGWTHTPGRPGYWTRPGKRFGISASITPSDNLWIWSSSVSPLEPEQSYTKFRFYSIMNHGGDDSAAASALRREGYGTPSEPLRDVQIVRGGGSAQVIPFARPGGAQGAGGASATAASPVPEPVIMQVSLTDDGNAQRLVAAISERLVFCPDRSREGVWYGWDGCRWAEQAGRSAAVQTFREIMRDWGVDPGDEAGRKHKIKSLGYQSIDRAVKLASLDPAIHVLTPDFDSDAYSLNTPSGVVDLRTGQVSAPTPAARHTRVTGCSVDFETIPVRWLEFLRTTFSEARNPEAMILFIQRLAGYSATGRVTHHVLPFLHGVGRNGKSVLLKVLQMVLGTYAGTAPADLLLAGGREDLAAQAELSGKRLVVASEVPPTAKFHEQRAKQLTGGDRVAARFLYANYFEFEPTHHLWLAGNHQPTVQSGGGAFWARMKMIPFDHVMPDEEQVMDLESILFAEEGPAILGWIVRGATEQFGPGGLAEPAEVSAATSNYAAEEDALGRFVGEELEIGGGARQKELISTVWDRYQNWCSRNGEKPLNKNRLGRELKGRFHIADGGALPGGGPRLYANVRVLPQRHEIEDDTVYEPTIT